MRKGIVMAEGRRGFVVLTPEGEFVEVPGRPDAAVGEEIGIDALPRRRTVPRGRLLIAASAAACLLLVAVGLARLPVFHGPKVAAYVAIDINPSVEIGVNRQRDVIKLSALNADGERVIEGVDYRRRPVGEVTADIIRNAEAADYLKDGGEVFVTSMTTADVDGTFEDELVREIGRVVRAAAPGAGGQPGPDEPGADGQSGSASGEGTGGTSASGTADSSGADPGAGTAGLSGSGAAGPQGSAGGKDAASPNGASSASGRNFTVTIVRAPGELRDTALANGVSPGKMAVYLLAEKQGLPIKLDDLRNGSIRQAVEPYGGLPAVLGDGRSDEERKRMLAEQLAKEKAEKEKAAKAKGKPADRAGGDSSRAESGKGASAGKGNNAPADSGRPSAAGNGNQVSAVNGNKAAATGGRQAAANAPSRKNEDRKEPDRQQERFRQQERNSKPEQVRGQDQSVKREQRGKPDQRDKREPGKQQEKRAQQIKNNETLRNGQVQKKETDKTGRQRPAQPEQKNRQTGQPKAGPPKNGQQEDRREQDRFTTGQQTKKQQDEVRREPTDGDRRNRSGDNGGRSTDHRIHVQIGLHRQYDAGGRIQDRPRDARQTVRMVQTPEIPHPTADIGPSTGLAGPDFRPNERSGP